MVSSAIPIITFRYYPYKRKKLTFWVSLQMYKVFYFSTIPQDNCSPTFLKVRLTCLSTNARFPQGTCRSSLVGLLPVVWFLTDWVVFTICLAILSPRLLRPSLNDWASALGILKRNVVHRIRMFLVFICILIV